MTIQEAHATAGRKARYGHGPWVVWKEGDTGRAERATPETIKAAMLATGTQQHFHGYDTTGTGNILRWRTALTWLRNSQGGYL